LSIGVAFEAQKFDRYTGHLVEDEDPWAEDSCTKIAKMRQMFSNSPRVQWAQMPSDKPLDYIVTDQRIYKSN